MSIKLADIRIEKLQAERPELFVYKPKPINFLEFSKTKLKEQQDQRRGQGSRAAKIVRWKLNYRFKNRARQPPLGECRIVDTRRDSSGKHLYFELSNGQCIRPDKFIRSGSNPVLAALALNGVQANASR
jgi:hypothetical protein